jgi:hypothetical protein
MARKSSTRKIGAKRMWIRRWLKAGRIAKAEAVRLTRHLDSTGELIKSSAKSAAPRRGRVPAVTGGAPAGSFVTIQFDPSRFRVQFTAIRRGRAPE